MQLDNFEFSKINIMKYVNMTFEKFFDENIKLIEEKHSEQVGGYFALLYYYQPREYEINFEHERLMFSIRIIRKDGSFTSVNHIYNGEINNALSKENVYEAIRLLSKALISKKISFYKVKKNRQVEVKE